MWALIVLLVLFGLLHEAMRSKGSSMHYLTKEIWWSWQNLNASDNGKVLASGLLYGRAWLHGTNWCLNSCWTLFRHRCALEIDVSDEGTSFYIALPFLFSVSLSIEHRWFRREWKGDIGALHRNIGVRVFSWGIWFTFWGDPTGWGPRRMYDFNVKDFFLGRNYHSERELQEWVECLVPMPEGDYPAKARVFESTWKRPRWPFPHRQSRVEMEMFKPIPIPGKGENDWDLDDNATYGMTCAALTVQEAVQIMKHIVMRDRERYGGKNWKPEAME